MSWAARRRFIILLIIGAMVAAFFAVIGIATFYKAPSCTDTVQNQDEAGVDCGGSCSYLCSAQVQPPTVLFTKALTNVQGRTDIVASIENKNATAAAKNVSYRVALYDNNQVLLQEVTGALDLPPGATETIFIPGVVSGKHTIANAFLDIAPSSVRWFTLMSDPRTMPVVSGTKLSGTATSPRVESVLINRSATQLVQVEAVVLVRNNGGTVIAASRTVLPSIPAQGQATATFTWNMAFPDTPASIEVVPIIPLPE